MRPIGKHFSVCFTLDSCRRAQFQPEEGDVLVREFKNGTEQPCRVLDWRCGPKMLHCDCVVINVFDIEPDDDIREYH